MEKKRKAEEKRLRRKERKAAGPVLPMSPSDLDESADGDETSDMDATLDIDDPPNIKATSDTDVLAKASTETTPAKDE